MDALDKYMQRLRETPFRRDDDEGSGGTGGGAGGPCGGALSQAEAAAHEDLEFELDKRILVRLMQDSGLQRLLADAQ